jgi:methionine salvage enolase-phosphatase E1
LRVYEKLQKKPSKNHIFGIFYNFLEKSLIVIFEKKPFIFSFNVFSYLELANADELIDALSANVREWIRLDRKLTPVKTLQGLIWEKGYLDGKIKAPIYDDVLELMRSVKFSSVPIFIYSSGSVQVLYCFFLKLYGFQF